jgi:NTE family protein
MAEHFQGGSYRADDRPARVARIDLTDGGMFDNLGLEPVWRDHAVLLVSDGAPTYATVQNANPAWRALRQVIILLDQATDVRRRWLLSNIAHQELRGTWWHIGTVLRGDDAGQARQRYSDHFVDEYISRTRIDLDSFSQGEIAVIENHGYLTTDVAIGRDFDYLSGGIRPPAAPPHPEWMEEDRARQALRNSSKVTLLGRGLVPVRPRGS